MNESTQAATDAVRPPQRKKLSSDPDFQNINPDIVNASRFNGFLRQPLELYLYGDLTWRETLETMVILLAKEHTSNKRLVVELVKGDLSGILLKAPEVAKLLRKPRKKKKQPRKKREPKWHYEI